jgi:hypothetical protein
MPSGMANIAETNVTITVPTIIGKIPPSLIPFLGLAKINSKFRTPIEFLTIIKTIINRNNATTEIDKPIRP